jgi:hypothetical protein
MFRLSLFSGHIQVTPVRNPKISFISSFSSSLDHFRNFRIRNSLSFYRLRSYSKYISGMSESQSTITRMDNNGH